MNQRAFEPSRKAVPSGLSGHCTPTPSPCQTGDEPHHLAFVSLVGMGEAERRRCSVGLACPGLWVQLGLKTDIKRNAKQRNLNISNLVSGYRQPIISFSSGFCPSLFLFLWIPHQPVGLCWVKPSSPLVAGLCLLNGDECQCHPAH